MKRAGTAAAALAVLAWSLAPIAWQLLTSLKSPEGLTRLPPILPQPFSLQSYAAVLGDASLLRMFLNSTVVAACSTALALALGAPAAFAVACLPMPGRRAFLLLALSSALIPAVALLGPLYSLIRALGLRDTWGALILTHGAFLLPLTVWTLAHFFSEVPRDLYRAGLLDGLGPVGIFWRLYLPLSTGGLAAAAILDFIFSWNEFLFALTFTNTDAARTVPVGIALFAGLHELPFGDLAAASIAVSLPVLALALVFQRGIVAGLTRGAVKG
ncbi:MAG: carbohydrate ABC transporter permease [Elusimicrobia bacterium]|nr:carbohydrate ABC transporter permease [Elusimicrobiota bacterium]